MKHTYHELSSRMKEELLWLLPEDSQIRQDVIDYKPVIPGAVQWIKACWDEVKALAKESSDRFYDEAEATRQKTSEPGNHEAMLRWKCFLVIDTLNGNPPGLASIHIDGWKFKTEPQLFKLLRGRERTSPTLEKVLEALRETIPIDREVRGCIYFKVQRERRKTRRGIPESVVSAVQQYLEAPLSKRSTIRRRIDELRRMKHIEFEEKPRLRL